VAIGLMLIWPSAASGGDAREEGQALATDLRNSGPTEPVEVRGTIRFRDGYGHRRNLPFHFRVLPTSEGWSEVYETPGDDDVSGQRLTVVHRYGEPNVYQLETLTKGGQASSNVKLTGLEAMVPFAGSDFWLVDLGLEYLHWPRHRIVEELKIQRRKGRPCYVLESELPDGPSFAYTRVLSWIDRETGKPILAQAYDPEGKLFKEFEVGGVTKVEGVWELKNLEMRNLRADSRTVLEFTYRERQ
jgi:hypothetical protein